MQATLFISLCGMDETSHLPGPLTSGRGVSFASDPAQLTVTVRGISGPQRGRAAMAVHLWVLTGVHWPGFSPPLHPPQPNSVE